MNASFIDSVETNLRKFPFKFIQSITLWAEKLLPAPSSPWPLWSSLPHWAPSTLASCEESLCLNAEHWLFPLPGKLFPGYPLSHFLTLFLSLLKCCLLEKLTPTVLFYPPSTPTQPIPLSLPDCLPPSDIYTYLLSLLFIICRPPPQDISSIKARLLSVMFTAGAEHPKHYLHIVGSQYFLNEGRKEYYKLDCI